MTLTRHATVRCQQRCISPQQIQIALEYGRPFKPDCLVLDDRSLEGTPYQDQTSELRGLCVILTPDNTVRTVMWVHSIRRRPGRLRRSSLWRRARNQNHPDGKEEA